jgi:hypothetical protein
MHNHAQVSTQGQYKLECEEIVARGWLRDYGLSATGQYLRGQVATIHQYD